MDYDHPMREFIREYIAKTGDIDLSIPPARGDFTARHNGLLKYLAFCYHGPKYESIINLHRDLVTALNEECPAQKLECT